MTTTALNYIALRASLNKACKDTDYRGAIEPGTYSNYMEAVLRCDFKVAGERPQAGRLAWKPIAIAAIKRLNFDSVNALVREIQDGTLTMPKKVTADDVRFLPKESLARKAFLLESLKGPTKMVDGNVTVRTFDLTVNSIREAL